MEKPARMWGDSKEVWLPTSICHQKQSKSDKYATPFSYPDRLPFYDREALEGKMRELRATKSHLLSVEEGLRERLTQAENVLMAMQSSKRELSTVASVLDGAAFAKQAARGDRKTTYLMMDKRRNYRGGGDKDGGDKCIPAACRQKCAANASISPVSSVSFLWVVLSVIFCKKLLYCSLVVFADINVQYDTSVPQNSVSGI